jgi:hypothetical protein
MANNIVVGDEVAVEFMKNKRGGKPICRIDGIVGFINNKERSFVAPCSTWMVRIDEIKEMCLVVTPLYKTKSAKENLDELAAKLNSLRMPKLKKEMHKKGYQYRSFAELKKDGVFTTDDLIVK